MALSDYDRQLLDRCLARESRAWEEFVDRFAGLLAKVVDHCAQARSLSLDSAQKEDLCAEILLTLIRDDMAVLKRFQRRASLATYLTVIGRRVALRQLLRHRHQVQSQADLDPELKAILNPDLDSADQVAYLLDQLNDLEAKLVQGFYLESLSYRDLALLHDIPENSIGPTLQRARQKMLRALTVQESGEGQPARAPAPAAGPSSVRPKSSRRQQQ